MRKTPGLCAGHDLGWGNHYLQRRGEDQTQDISSPSALTCSNSMPVMFSSWDSKFKPPQSLRARAFTSWQIHCVCKDKVSQSASPCHSLMEKPLSSHLLLEVAQASQFHTALLCLFKKGPGASFSIAKYSHYLLSTSPRKLHLLPNNLILPQEVLGQLNIAGVG